MSFFHKSDTTREEKRPQAEQKAGFQNNGNYGTGPHKAKAGIKSTSPEKRGKRDKGQGGLEER